MATEFNFFEKLDQHCSTNILKTLCDESSDSFSKNLTNDDLDASLNLSETPVVEKLQSNSKVKSDPKTKSKSRSVLQTEIIEPSPPAPCAVRRITPRSAANQGQPKEPQPVDVNTPPLTSIRSRRRTRRGQNPPAQSDEIVAAVQQEISNSTAKTTSGRRKKTANISRRREVAEIAARSTHVDFIDLVSSPFPRVEGMISLLSDDEETENTETSNVPTSTVEDCSLEESNPEICIKVIWCGKYETFTLRKHQKFVKIFNALAEKAQIMPNQVLMNLNDRVLLPDDSAASIDYKAFDFISGRIMAQTSSNLVAKFVQKKCGANEIMLKIQSDKWKHPLQVSLGKTDKFHILFIKCAEELNVGMQTISLSFDGEPLGYDGTPLEFELEGGEVIDLRVKT